MSEDRFKVVYRGKIGFSRRREEVATNLRTRFRFSEEALRRLFSGRPVTLKKNLPQGAARRLAEAMEEVGAPCVVQPMPQRPATDHAAPPPWQDGPFQATGLSSREGGCETPDGVAMKNIVAAMTGTRPWVRFISVIMFVCAALALLGAAAALFYAGMTAMDAPAVLIAALQIMIVLLYLFPAYFLFKYSRAIRVFLKEGGIDTLEVALGYQKSFWKFIGILTTVLLAIAVLGIVAAIALPELLGR